MSLNANHANGFCMALQKSVVEGMAVTTPIGNIFRTHCLQSLGTAKLEILSKVVDGVKEAA